MNLGNKMLANPSSSTANNNKGKPNRTVTISFGNVTATTTIASDGTSSLQVNKSHEQIDLKKAIMMTGSEQLVKSNSNASSSSSSSSAASSLLSSEFIRLLKACQDLNVKSKGPDGKQKYDEGLLSVIAEINEALKQHPDEVARLIVERELLSIPVACISENRSNKTIFFGLQALQGLMKRASEDIAIFNKHKVIESLVKIVKHLMNEDKLLLLHALRTLSGYASEGGQEACDVILAHEGLDIITKIVKRELQVYENLKNQDDSALEKLVITKSNDSRTISVDTAAKSKEKRKRDDEVNGNDVDNENEDDDNDGSDESGEDDQIVTTKQAEKWIEPNVQQANKDDMLQKTFAALRFSAWILRSLCDHIPNPSSSLSARFIIGDVLDCLYPMLLVGDNDIVIHCCWAISHLCDGTSSYIHDVMDADKRNKPTFCELLISYLDKSSSQIIKPALRAIGNIVCCEDDLDYDQDNITGGNNNNNNSNNNSNSAHRHKGDGKHATDKNQSGNNTTNKKGKEKARKSSVSNTAAMQASKKATANSSGNLNNTIEKGSSSSSNSDEKGTSPISSRIELPDYTQDVIDLGIIPKLVQLINHQHKEIQKESCWTLSNIAAGKISQIQTFIDSGVVPLLLEKSMVQNVEVRVDNDIRTESRWAILNCMSCGISSQVEEVAKLGGIGVLLATLDETDPSMVLMALEGIDKVIDINYQYLAHINSERILQLIRRQPLSVSRRADALWQKHFVQCQICKKAFTRMSKVTKYCTECKCFVCSSCNCVVYHLSYQDQLWKDEEQQKGKKDKKKTQQPNANTKQPLTSNTKGDDGNKNSENVSEKITKTNDDVQSSGTSTNIADDDVDALRYVNYLLKTGSILALAALMESDDMNDLKLQ